MERFAGRYGLLRSLGEGGMGTVHLALDLTTGSECALKRLHPRTVGGGHDTLRREFELLARVRHPSVVSVIDLGFGPDGTPYYTMEYVPGVPADQGLRRGDWRALCFAAAEVTHGLEALHAAGVLHGDLKPSNVLVIPGGGPESLPAGVRILDFGLAALLDREREGRRGTPGFAAPEVVRGEMPVVASDLYGLGATLFALAAGRVTFATSPRRSSAAVREAQTIVPSAVALDEAGVPPRLAQLILRLMAPSIRERPSDAREVRSELERIEPSARRSLARRLRTEIVTGRERELARLERWLARAPEGPVVTIVAGEPGSGKSALLGELSIRSALAGRSVIRFSCAAFAGPGGLARSLWRRLAAEARAEEDPAEPSRRAVALLERIEPGLGDADITLLADAAIAWGRQVRARGSLAVVLLDDRECLDALSRTLVRRAVFHPFANTLRWVWTGRAGGPEAEEQDRVLLEAGQAEMLKLGALASPAVERLVSVRLHRQVPRDLLSFLLERGSGLPGLLVELLKTAAERGALVESEEGLAVDAIALARVALPAGFEASLMERLDALPAAARSVAEALAVVARPTRPAALRSLDPAADSTAIASLLEMGLVTGDEAAGYALASPAFGSLVLAKTDPERRRLLHRAALVTNSHTSAERFAHLRGAGDPHGALESARAAFVEAPGVALALEAGQVAEADAPEQAREWFQHAAELLVAEGRHGAAIAPLERSLQLEAEGLGRFERWGLLSTAYLRAGRLDEFERLIERARASSPSPRELVSVMANEAARLSSLGELAPALARAKEALELARSTGAADAIGVAAVTLSGIHLLLNQIDEARSSAHEADETYARAKDAGGRARALGQRANIAFMAGARDEAAQLYREALAIARSSGKRLAAEELLGNLALVLLSLGRWEAATESCEEALRIALEDGRPAGVAVATVSLALIDGLSGRPARALRRGRAAVRLTRGWLPRRESTAWRALGQALRIAGHARRAERALSRGLAIAGRMGLQHELDWCRIEYLRSCTMASRWRDAGEVADRALAGPDSDDPIARAVLIAISGRAALRRSDLGAAGSRLDQCVEAIAGQGLPYAEAHLKQLRAERALVLGDSRLGFELAREALDAYAGLPAPADRAMAALDFARLSMQLDGGGPAPVQGWLQEAAGAFERLGDHASRERTLALTVEWLHRARPMAANAANERDLLQSVGRLLDSLSNLQEFERRAMQMAVEHLGAERGVLLLTDPVSGEMTSVVEHGAVDAATRSHALSYSHRVVERVARSGGSLLIGDAPTHPDVMSESVVGLGLRSILCVPLYGGGKVVGAVYVDDSRRPDAFTRDDRGLLEGFAHLMATAIENSRGHDEVRRANEQLVGENLSLRREARVKFQPQNFIGTSSTMQAVLAMVERAAQIATTVLITGENGTGKELIARILHHSGRRSQGPFVGINCGAIPENLLESELFGILPSVATGVRGRDGRFVQANGGTLFLDEVGEMPLKQQVALLSAIANREITPVGGGDPIPVDVRIIAATNRDLRRSLEEGSFREDLYYRLNVIPIELPPLRERKADIPAMAHHFAAKIAEHQERDVPELSPEFIAALMQSDWPGNVRELQNYVERVMAMTPGRVLQPRPLPRDLETRGTRLRITHGKRLEVIVREIEQRMMREALERSAGNQSRAARELGLTEQSLRYRLRKYQLVETREYRRTRKKRR